ncbi:MAG: hypothetical protein Q9227_003713 [Pyrenula ochraceoflavens]
MPSSRTNSQKREDSFINCKAAPWTAARCNRTLRQLRAFLVKLEKWHRSFSHATRKEEDHPVRDGGKRSIKNEEARREHDIAPNSEIDEIIRYPEWLQVPRVLSKRKPKTYGGSARLRNGRPPRSLPKLPKTPKACNSHYFGKIGIDTPFITMATGPVAHDVMDRPNLRSQPNIFKQRIFKGSSLDSKDYDSLMQPFQTIIFSFLDATADSGRHCSGARSLLSICQRKLPQYICQEQHAYDLLKSEADDEYDVASSIFTELEDAFSPASGTGWRLLRGIVRAYGLYLVCRAIEQGQLRVSTAKTLLAHSYRSVHSDAFEAFATALFAVEEPRPLIGAYKGLQGSVWESIFDPDDIDSFPRDMTPYHMAISKILVLQEAVERGENQGTLQSLVGHRLVLGTWLNRLLSPPTTGWLSSSIAKFALRNAFFPQQEFTRAKQSEMSPTLIVGGTVLPEEQTDADSFKVQEENVNIILTILVSVLLTRSKEKTQTRENASTPLSNIFQYLSILAEQSREFGHENESTRSSSLLPFYISLFVLGPEINLLNWKASIFALEGLLKQLPWRTEALAPTVDFLLGITDCCGRMERSDGFNSLERLVHRIISFENVDYPNILFFFQNIASSVAMTFAQARRTECHLKWAADVQANTIRHLRNIGMWEPPTPGLLHRKPYRWEISIEEWVEEIWPLRVDETRNQHDRTLAGADDSPKRAALPKLRVQTSTQETPTPDLLALPNPRGTSPPSPSRMSQELRHPKRSRDEDEAVATEIQSEDAVSHKRKAPRRHYSRSKTHSLRPQTANKRDRTPQGKREKCPLQLRMDRILSDELGADELADTPVRTESAPRRPALMEIKNSRFKTGFNKKKKLKTEQYTRKSEIGISQVTEDIGSEDELGL